MQWKGYYDLGLWIPCAVIGKPNHLIGWWGGAVGVHVRAEICLELWTLPFMFFSAAARGRSMRCHAERSSGRTNKQWWNYQEARSTCCPPHCPCQKAEEKIDRSKIFIVKCVACGVGKGNCSLMCGFQQLTAVCCGAPVTDGFLMNMPEESAVFA